MRLVEVASSVAVNSYSLQSVKEGVGYDESA